MVATPNPTTASTSRALTATSAAPALCRFAHFTARSTRPTGRATIGSPASHRRRSSASSLAVAYRFFACFSRHFMQIVFRSAGSLG